MKQVKPKVKSVLYKAERLNGKIPTQKPRNVGDFVIKHLTNESDKVLDSFGGSGSFGVSCILYGRQYIGIEVIDDNYKLAESNLQYEIIEREHLEREMKKKSSRSERTS